MGVFFRACISRSVGIVSDAGVHDTVQGLSVRDLNHLRLSRCMIIPNFCVVVEYGVSAA